MGRSEAKKIVAQGTTQSAQDQANAQASLAATNKSLSDYSSGLKGFLRFGRQTYGPNGEFARDQNIIANTTAAAGANKVGGDLALNAMRTGESTANYAPTLAESQRAASRDMTSQLAGADATRLQQLTDINKFGVQASALPASVQAGLYGTSTSGATGQLGVAGQAAQQKGFWDEFAPALAQGAGAAAGGYFGCPCEGSLILMADDTKKPVEELKDGDLLWPMGSSTPPNPLLAKPKPIKQPCYEIVTRGGLRHKASSTHSVALACGGYALTPELMGQTILCGKGTDVVVEVRDIGVQNVYEMNLGGSHCYRADGLWIFA